MILILDFIISFKRFLLRLYHNFSLSIGWTLLCKPNLFPVSSYCRTFCASPPLPWRPPFSYRKSLYTSRNFKQKLFINFAGKSYYNFVFYYAILYYIVMLCFIMLYYIILYHIILYYVVMLCYVMLCYVMLCYIILFYIILYYIILYYIYILYYVLFYYILYHIILYYVL